MTSTSERAQLQRMAGRDPEEPGRTASPLELLFDLSFAVAFGIAGEQTAHLLARGHVGAALAAFPIALFAICWAWVNFSWFASAFDTDDWVYRLTTMVVMVGVIVTALGLPAMFHSVAVGHDLDLGVMVAGYVVMRASMVVMWLRAAAGSAARRRECLTYVTTIVVAQVLWVVLTFLHLDYAQFLVAFVVVAAVEVAGPVVAERGRDGTPWHAHHIAERYGLLTIIALGEGVIATVATVSAAGAEEEWTLEAVLFVVAGTLLTFGMWWCYFVIDFAHLLARHRSRSFGWGYGHMVVFAAVVGVGAGLHLTAYAQEDEVRLSTTAVLLATAVPLVVYLLGLFALFALLTRWLDPFHLLLGLGTALVVAVAVGLSLAGLDLSWCLLVLALAPLVTVLGYETVGWRHQRSRVG